MLSKIYFPATTKVTAFATQNTWGLRAPAQPCDVAESYCSRPHIHVQWLQLWDSLSHELAALWCCRGPGRHSSELDMGEGMWKYWSPSDSILWKVWECGPSTYGQWQVVPRACGNGKKVRCGPPSAGVVIVQVSLLPLASQA